MTKIELLLEEEKIGQLKAYATEQNFTIVFSEAMLFEPGKQHTKKYRGAEYVVEQVKKIKADIYIEEERISSIKEYLILHLLDKDKNDMCVISEIAMQF